MNVKQIGMTIAVGRLRNLLHGVWKQITMKMSSVLGRRVLGRLRCVQG